MNKSCGNQYSDNKFCPYKSSTHISGQTVNNTLTSYSPNQVKYSMNLSDNKSSFDYNSNMNSINSNNSSFIFNKQTSNFSNKFYYKSNESKKENKHTTIYTIVCSSHSNNLPDGIFSKDYISKLNSNQFEYDTLCQSAVICGLKKENIRLLEQTEDFSAVCGHKECSLFAALNPCLLQTYQNKNKKFQIPLNDITANLVFPLGVKLCFMPNKQRPKDKEPFMNVLKNDKGEVAYIVTTYYFKKISIREFESKYKINPLKEYGKTITSKSLKEISQNILDRNTEIYARFTSNDYVYLPESISLISRFPFYSPLRKALQTLLQFDSWQKANSLIAHLIDEVPIPESNQKINFFIPLRSEPITIINPELPNFNGFYSENIFDFLSPTNIIQVFMLILLEQQILFIGDDFKKISSVAFFFINIIYPFLYMNSFIPVLSIDTVKFLQNFMPFIHGIDYNLFFYAWQKGYIKNENNKTVFVDITRNVVCLDSKHLNRHKNNSRKTLLKVLEIPNIPENLENFLHTKLSELKKVNNLLVINQSVKNIFCEVMATMLGNYKSYLFHIEDTPILNGESFVDEKEKSDRDFYTEFINTGLFKYFLQYEREMFRSLYYEKVKKEENINRVYNTVKDIYFYDLGYFEETKKLSGNRLVKRKSSLRLNLFGRKKHEILPNNKLEVLKSTYSSKSVKKSNLIKRLKFNNSDDNSPEKTSKSKASRNTFKASFNTKHSSGKTMDSNKNVDNKFKDQAFLNQSCGTKIDNYTMTNLNYNLSKISNLNSGDLNSNVNDANKNAENEETNDILLFPYFIPEPAKNLNEVELNSYIQKKVEIYINSENEISKILKGNDNNAPSNVTTRRNPFDLDKIRDELRRYFIYSLYFDPHNDETPKNFSKRMSQMFSMEKLASENAQRVINEWFKSVCVPSKKSKKKYNVNVICELLNSKENRKYFIILLSQGFFDDKLLDSTLDENNVIKKLVTLDSLSELCEAIKYALTFLDKGEYSICKMFTMTMFYYYSINPKTKEEKLLIEDYITLFQPSKLWTQSDFWKFWYNDEVEKKQNSDNDSNEDDYDSVEYKILLKMASIMKRLNLVKEFIKIVLVDKLAVKNLDKNEKNKLNRDLTEM